MLTADQLATIRAALRFWQDEMVRADKATTRHYFDVSPHPSLTTDEIENLIEQLRSDPTNL